MGWRDWVAGRGREGSSELDSLHKWWRRDEGNAEHLRRTTRYRHISSQPLVFQGLRTPDVILDRVYESDGDRVHVMTPTRHYGRAQVQCVASLAAAAREVDPTLLGLVLFWPRQPYEAAEFHVPLFDVVPWAEGRTTIVYGDQVLLDRIDGESPYASPSYGPVERDELAAVMGVDERELSPLMPEIHQLCAATPGWFEACEQVDRIKDEVFADMEAVMREHGVW